MWAFRGIYTKQTTKDFEECRKRHVSGAQPPMSNNIYICKRPVKRIRICKKKLGYNCPRRRGRLRRLKLWVARSNPAGIRDELQNGFGLVQQTQKPNFDFELTVLASWVSDAFSHGKNQSLKTDYKHCSFLDKLWRHALLSTSTLPTVKRLTSNT
jgi:hypothetical protein